MVKVPIELLERIAELMDELSGEDIQDLDTEAINKEAREILDLLDNNYLNIES